MRVLFCISLIAVVHNAISLSTRAGSVRYHPATGTFNYVPSGILKLGRDTESYPAIGEYSDWTSHPSGFGVLKVNTSSLFTDRVQFMAAGFLEGYVTAERISELMMNAKWYVESHVKDMNPILSWMGNHTQWLRAELAARRRTFDPWWAALDLVIAQLDGLVLGYNAAVSDQGDNAIMDHITLVEFMLVNSIGDSGDLFEYIYNGNVTDDWPDDASTAEDMRTRLALRGHCSVLIKVTGDLKDLLIGHVTWGSYSIMNRIYKHYNFNVRSAHYPGALMSFSSYPGMISSLDDWYIMGGDSKLLVTETTNDVLDRSLFEGNVKPDSALSWQRVRVANLLGRNGTHWAQQVSQLNSGTYNNQYMILDLKLFTPGTDLKPGLLTIAEQMPGDVVVGDATGDLERGHWPSYNVPYFPEVYNKTGYTAFKARAAARGESFKKAALAGVDYQLASRAKIFRRDQGVVSDLTGLKAILRQNKWTSDPYSTGSVWDAICSRGDLSHTHPVPAGCTDAKVSSYSLAMERGSEVINGPPRAGEVPGYSWTDVAPFSWDASPLKHVMHRGQPDMFKFTYEVMKP